MGLSKKVAKMRLWYHANCIELNNVLNQLGIRDGYTAEKIAKKHTMVLFNDVFPRIYGEEKIKELLKNKK